MEPAPDTTPAETAPAPEPTNRVESGKVLVTGGTGFVGGHVVRELVARGYEPVCLVRNPDHLGHTLPKEQRSRLRGIAGDILNPDALARAARGCTAAIHLVGIIEERRLLGRTFQRLHVDATQNVVNACAQAGVLRYVHMSALGTRPDAVSAYHQTKWAAEQIVRGSSLAWTIFRPSLIHGPDGEFMQMMKFFATSRRQPLMPYFGRGTNLLQPISVRDVAAVFVKSLAMPETIGQVYELGGPDRFTWKELYDVCARTIAGSPRLKVSVPVFAAKLAASTVIPLVPRLFMPYKFNVSQVQMSQEDSVCNPAVVEKTFGIRLRAFREELEQYADLL